MIEMIFGLNARIGRLMYFLSGLGLGVVSVVLAIPLVFYIHSHHIPITTPASLWAVGWPAYGFVGVCLFGQFTLASMRVRDIGWDPVIVIAGWIALLVVNHLFGARVPAIAVVTGLVNLGMELILLFWPGGDPSAVPPSLDDYKPRSPDKAGANSASIPAQRFAKANGQFGRRA